MTPLLWTQKADTGPAARMGHAMAFDAVRGRTVLFGGEGEGGARLGDTWEWDGEDWTQVADSGPLPRSRFALAFHAYARRTLLFGGDGAAGALADTWLWDGATWTQVADTGPAARSGHALAHDGQRDRTVLFGGLAAAGYMRDTWEWDGADWTQIEDVGPPPRTAHAMAWDGGRQRSVLFGGAAGALGDTWEWDGATWTQESDFGPHARLGAALAFKGDDVALFGGAEGAAPAAAQFGDTWAWDGRHWTQRQDMGPAARRLHAIAFDAGRGHLVLFGGRVADGAGGLSADTWEHSDGTAGPPAAIPAVASITADTTTLAVGATANVTIALTGPGPTGGPQMAVTWQGPAASALVLADGTSLAATPQPAEVDVAGTSQVTFAVTLSQAVAVNPGDVLITFTASLQGAGRQLDLRAA